MPDPKVKVELTLIDRLSGAAQKAAEKIRGIAGAGEVMARSVDASMRRVQSSMEIIGTSLDIKRKILDPGVQAAASVQDAFKDLELTLNLGGGEKAKKTLQMLSQEAARVAGPTKFSQAQMLGVQNELAKAGLGVSDIAGKGGAAEAAAMLAQAEGMSSESATSAILTMATTMGVSGKEFMKAANLLAAASQASTASADSLAQGLSMAPTLGQTGWSKDSQLAFLAALDQSGKKGTAGGSAVSSFLREVGKHGKELGAYDGKGNIKSLTELAIILRTKTAGMTQEKRDQWLQQMFGDEGKAAAIALMNQGPLERILDGMGAGMTLDAKALAKSGIYNGQVDALGGTIESALATLFTPALDPLSQAAGTLNDAAGKINDYAVKNPALAKSVSYGAIGATLAPLALLLSGRGGDILAGIKTGNLSSVLGGKGSMAKSIAEGKALEKMAGVQPVYVVNWPASMGGGAAGDAVAAAAGKSDGLLGKMAGASAAFSGGWAAGSYMNENWIKGTSFETYLQSAMAQMTLTLGGGLLMSKQDADATRRVANENSLIKGIRDALGLNINLTVSDTGVQMGIKDSTGKLLAAERRVGAT